MSDAPLSPRDWPGIRVPPEVHTAIKSVATKLNLPYQATLNHLLRGAIGSNPALYHQHILDMVKRSIDATHRETEGESYGDGLRG